MTGKKLPPGSCPHDTRFFVHGAVSRLTDTDGGPVTAYRVDVHVSCDDCGHPFEFVGLPVGLAPNLPTVSAARTELRAPIQPARPRRARLAAGETPPREKP